MKFTYESLKSPNGQYIRENRIKKNFPEEYEDIIKYSIKNNVENIHFSQKLWIYLHKSSGIPKCKCCSNEVKFESFNYGYKKYCSNKCAANDKELQEKRKATNLERYGSEETFGSKIIQKKIKKTFKERYGVENAMHIDGSVDKVKRTTKERYGVENAMQLKKFKEIAMETNIKNNGKFNLLLDKNRQKAIKKTHENFKNTYPNLKFITITGDTLTLPCDKCGSNYDINRSTLRFRYNNNIDVCTNCNIVDKHNSFIESTLSDFISAMGFNHTTNDRKLIKPKELDIIIPSKKIAIELNGLLWHSDKYIDSSYHLNKTKECNKKGFHLLHVFEDEWLNKKNIVQSIIKNQLGITENKIYARKCHIKQLNSTLCNNFLEENHIQGKVNSSIKLGLYYSDELVAVMTFSSLRKSLGSKSKPNEYELLRYCSKINTTIVGGSSKLFKYFIRNYRPKRVISYANRRFFSGNMYNKLGMVKIGESKPNYFYYDGKNVKRQNRFKYRKSELVKQGFDKTKTEREIMKDRGFYRIYDCGTFKYEWLEG